MRYAPNRQDAQGARQRRAAVKKLSTVQGSGSRIFKDPKLTIGLDLGDRSSYYCVLDEAGRVIHRGNVSTRNKAMGKVFGSMARCRIGMEVGTHKHRAIVDNSVYTTNLAVSVMAIYQLREPGRLNGRPRLHHGCTRFSHVKDSSGIRPAWAAGAPRCLN
jgi:hypothetical protein